MKDIVIPITRESPRIGENSQETGAYKQIFRNITPVIDPGDTINIEQYFSGYGIIQNAKLLSYPSDNIFDIKYSKIFHSVGPNKDGNVAFGVSENKFKGDGMYFDLSSASGIKLAKWKDRTYFFDASDKDSTISLLSTERKIGGFPPFKYELKTQQSIRPGTYYLEFCFTYFDGQNWQVDQKNVEFKVRNFLERNDQIIGIVALLASTIAIIEFGVIPLLEWVIALL